MWCSMHSSNWWRPLIRGDSLDVWDAVNSNWSEPGQSEDQSLTCTFDVLQRAQNTIARVVILSLKRDHTKPTLKRLHWLPVRQRVTYKIDTLIYNIRRSREPDYLYSFLEEYTLTWHLRSTNTQRLCVLRTKLKTEDHAFSIAAPRVWNVLTSEVTSA